MFFRKNDVPVPDTSDQQPPAVPLSMRMGHWVYTLSDEWLIREDVVFKEMRYDYVLASRHGVYSVYMQPFMGYVVGQGSQLKINGEIQDHIIKTIRARNNPLEKILGVRVIPVAMFDNSDIRGFDVAGVKIANPELLVNYLEALQVVSVPARTLAALGRQLRLAQD